MPPHAETHAERLARYRRLAEECRDQAALTLDSEIRFYLRHIAECYELLATIEAGDVPGALAADRPTSGRAQNTGPASELR
jgi:hypothetical protein